MLTGKQKRFLRHEAHHLNAIFQIGKDGLHENQIIGIDEALESRELIKVKILESCKQDKNEIAQELSLKTDDEVVQTFYTVKAKRKFIVYHENRNFWRLF